MEKIKVDGMSLAYRELGLGPTVLLLHGWPTSSYLWRNVMPAIAHNNRVVALDLPGFGESDKPVDVRYTFGFFCQAIDGLLAELGVERIAIAGHDFGGPVALRWALDHPAHITGVALLNTLVYPEFPDAIVDFVTRLRDPQARAQLTSQQGLARELRRGVIDETVFTHDLVAAMVAPFADDDSRLALANAGIGLERKGFVDLAGRLPELHTPLRVIYGVQDRFLPDITETVARVQRDVPHAEVTALPYCGHFLQEEAPHEVGEMLAGFFSTLT
jgi:pimeloyl-ACP methyl ester carboxylesterase